MGHLKTAHNETSDNPQGVRRMKSHLDARDWYSSVYEWTFDNGAVLESVQRSTRTKATRMY